MCPEFFRKRRRLLRLCLPLALLQLLAACGTLAPLPPSGTSPQTGAPAENRWHFVRFQLAPDGAGAVQRHLDGLIADRVIAPQLSAHRALITLWRFHRRWPRDHVGHLFSFIFLGPPMVGDEIEAALDANPELARLHADGHLKRFWMERRDTGAIAATSDPRWPPEIARQWPDFAMGASRTWLGLVREESSKRGLFPLYARYRQAEAEVDRYWSDNGYHTFLHHLNALFGYQRLRLPDGQTGSF